MKKTLITIACLSLLASSSAFAINKTYRKQLERSGCTQVTEAQGCDITKTKEENARAGFGGTEAGAPQAHAASLDDIKGMEGVKAFDEMTARGFDGVDTFYSGNDLVGIYYNRSTHQCIQLLTVDNRIHDVTDIQTHPKCH